ncbi:transcriptional regulator GcvA [Maricaulis sp.]|jgi:LysR family glycine cleavage system transcriptional activator|uniref:transcriptional regulator GcvA n=1 Tax=Maricaulis sp. TaxID=1486257 RepID=UPI00260DEB5A|nr:transcriptional regulator GcvA [Maricaulis sp.]
MARSSRLPPLNALRAFEAAARLESFARAADELAVTPGAISQQIRSLEDHVGTPLFVREGRGLTLTGAGRAAANVTSEAFETLERAVSLMRQPVQRRALTVSVAPSFAGKWLAPRLHRFQDDHPGVEVWIAATSERVDLGAGAADLAIRYGPGGDMTLNEERLLPEEVLPVCSPDLLRDGVPLTTPRDLAGHTLLHDASPESEVDGADWSAWLKARNIRGVAVAGGVRFNQSALVIDAAVAGRGVALAKRALAQNDLASGRLVALFADGTSPVRSAYHIVTARNRPLSPDAEGFIAWLRAEARMHEHSVDEL